MRKWSFDWEYGDVAGLVILLAIVAWIVTTVVWGFKWVFVSEFKENAHLIVRGPVTEWQSVEAGATLYSHRRDGEMHYFADDFTLRDGSYDQYHVDIKDLIPGEDVSGNDLEGNLWIVFLPSEYERHPYGRPIKTALVGGAALVVGIPWLRSRRKR